MAEFAVIGLGRFGRAVVHNLALEGQEVLAIDRDRERLRMVDREAESTLCLDTTDEGALATVPLGRMATVVVSIGSRAPEASLLTVAVLKELDVPRIVARAFDPRHARLLHELGAHEVLNPEDEMAGRLAARLAHPRISDQIRIGEASVAELELPESFAGSTLGELALGARYDVAVLALRRGTESRLDPGPDERVESGDRAIVMGPAASLERIAVLV